MSAVIRGAATVSYRLGAVDRNAISAAQEKPMNTSEHFLRMFAYDSWANHQTLSAMQAARLVSSGTVGRMAHILSAQKLWFERLRGESQSLPVWPTASLQDCMALTDEMANLWRNYLTPLQASAFHEKVEYRNSKGEPWSSRVEDVLTHVLLHSAYHRGQVALEMRAAGKEPAYTDFIHAVRQGFVE
ncbi:MAG: DinB family protein [Acidobacteriia bacterium]|nr:DinB family protein [Terriglobia bacterium]